MHRTLYAAAACRQVIAGRLPSVRPEAAERPFARSGGVRLAAPKPMQQLEAAKKKGAA
ncbi:hypothetical protein [Paenibacillus konkukensis]|uniref:hypothetical protein n=1 Tax=Paenibacillus konkukensis TaxID=2020716 RepID=UPI00201E3119|nr:hypothetical protein [Paenibacillus konkukensis]